MADARGELTPTGVLRFVVNLGNAALTRLREGRTPGPRARRGARRIADRLGVPLAVLPYPSGGAIMKAEGEWDAAVLAVDASRMILAFSPPIATVDAMYAVRADGPRTFADVDQAGVRIAEADGAAYTAYLRRTVRRAPIVPASAPAEALQLLLEGGCDAAAGLGEALRRRLAKQEGLRLLSEPFLSVPQAIAVPSAHRAAAALVGRSWRVADLPRPRRQAAGALSTEPVNSAAEGGLQEERCPA